MSEELITVIGAGVMGSGIAQKYATHGYKVFLIDKSRKALEKGKQAITSMIDKAVKKNVFSNSKASNILNNLTYTTDLQNAKDSGLVIEAIFEDFKIKRELFKYLDGLCNNTTILATNTSSFLVSSLQKNLVNQQRIIGLHYFFHPAKNRLVEVVKGTNTKEEYINRAITHQKNINKTAILCKDSPGFIVNRFFVPWLNEAMHIVNEGKANIATVEHAAKKFFKISMGPFKLMNLTGLEIAYKASVSLKESLGDFYAPSPLITPMLKKKQLWDLEGEIQEEQVSYIAHRLLNVVAHVCHELVYKDKVCDEESVDTGARVGLLWEKGPFDLIKTFLNKHPNASSNNKTQEISFR